MLAVWLFSTDVSCVSAKSEGGRLQLNTAQLKTGAWLYGVHRMCAETAAVSHGTSHVTSKQHCHTNLFLCTQQLAAFIDCEQHSGSPYSVQWECTLWPSVVNLLKNVYWTDGLDSHHSQVYQYGIGPSLSNVPKQQLKKTICAEFRELFQMLELF